MKNLIHRKEKIIFTAIEVINEMGVQNLSTKMIAKKQDIAESTIFKHFENKSTLLIAVLDFYSQYDDDIIKSIEMKKLEGLEAINYFMESFIKYYENYPEITAITQGIDDMRYIDNLSEKVIEISNKRYNCMMKMVEQSQQKGELSTVFSAESYTDLIMGGVNGIIRRWRMESYGFSLLERCKKSLAIVIGEGNENRIRG
ncbi:MAG: TetR/AcrR family transcriptional regulator [Clostridiales bacterium]|nr:TetR/AcrR family transcriptional regulator [Clostridiales bacterium]